PGSVSPGPFPAKLWRLANSPRCGSIFWDARGERLLIDQRLLQRELLGARPGGGGAEGAAGLFKTKNFASFVRQLNLYGFRKAGPGPAGSAAGPVGGDGGSPAGPLHHFQSPHFRRARPDLLLHVQRLTGADKAKLAAGLQGSSRPPTGCQQ
ncbi:HSF5 protein, partial [Podargus strigoides]|nr:HSF5 protein [Podargus strigoides]